MQITDPKGFLTAEPVNATPGTSPIGRVNVFGLRLVNDTASNAIAHLLSPGKRRVAFLNAHCVNMMSNNPRYQHALSTADVVLPDGAGIEIALRLQGDRMVENLNGTDFTPRLMDACARLGLSVFLLGGRPGTAEAAAARLQNDIPALRIAGTRDGFDGVADTNAAIDAINASGADVVLVAMGVPKQDIWIADNADRLTARLCLGVGALFDFLAGNVARAPKRIRKMRMEWVWRLAMEPRRMARRYLVGNATFLARAAAAALPRANAKRALDIAVSGCALVLLSPVLAAAALAIKLDSKGPVFFTQTRIGKDGRPFAMKKFRSMFIDAEARRAALLASSDRDGICFKSRNDPRITRVGRLLRRTSLDELPQIINVLIGDMSIVGPRPALPCEVDAYPKRALGRLVVKPGITGVWQVSGRAEIGFDKMIDMDLAYARRPSILLDVMLIALTFRAVVSGRGAY